jgi:hypothetical protein
LRSMPTYRFRTTKSSSVHDYQIFFLSASRISK